MRYLLQLLTLTGLLFATFNASAQTYNPVANPAAVVTVGNARFTILTDRVIRLEYSPAATFNDAATITFLNRELPVPDFKQHTEKGELIIETAYLTLHYKLNSGNFKRSNLRIDYHDNTHNFTWHPGLKDKRNLKGTTRTLDGTLGGYSFHSMHKIDLGQGLLSRSGWALVDDSRKPTFDSTEWPWVQNSATAANTDLYFFGYGSNYKAALYDFTSISGKISLPPKFAFGIWYSRYWQYSEQDLKDIVAGYRSNGLPLDVLVIDMDWHQTRSSDPDVFARYKPTPDGWTGFTWTKKYFPDYKRFLAWTDSNQLKTCLNLHPASGVQPHEYCYRDFARAMNLDTTLHATIPFDITNKQFAKNYFDVLLHPYEKQGIDFWWLDWQQFNRTKIEGVNPTFYLNYVHYSDMQRQGKRPLIFHRYGGLGNQRYQIGFSGDVMISWKSLAYQPYFTATAANVGFGFWSHDIGGHWQAGDQQIKQDAELFTRWIQWGALSPIFRTHATNDPGIERRMWQYPPAHFAAMKKAVLLRCSLLPYIYSYSRMAYDSAFSLVHPMYYEYPDKDEAYHCNNQYYFGKDMIVAPISEPMNGKEKIDQSIWLPEGYWYDYRTNERIEGGTRITRGYALDEIPVFVKQGSIIPQQPIKQRADAPLDTVILKIYCGSNGNFDLYEDDGSTDAYRAGHYSFTRLEYVQGKDGVQLSITPDGKTFDGQLKERVWQLQFINSRNLQRVLLNGEESSLHPTYEETNKTVQVQISKGVKESFTLLLK